MHFTSETGEHKLSIKAYEDEMLGSCYWASVMSLLFYITNIILHIHLWYFVIHISSEASICFNYPYIYCEIIQQCTLWYNNPLVSMYGKRIKDFMVHQTGIISSLLQNCNISKGCSVRIWSMQICMDLWKCFDRSTVFFTVCIQPGPGVHHNG